MLSGSIFEVEAAYTLKGRGTVVSCKVLSVGVAAVPFRVGWSQGSLLHMDVVRGVERWLKDKPSEQFLPGEKVGLLIPSRKIKDFPAGLALHGE